MTRRLLLVICAAVMSMFVLLSCSKRSGIDEQMYGLPIDIIKNLAPSPMPPDTLELDSLRRQPFL